MAFTPIAGALGNLSSVFEIVGWAVVGGITLTVYGFLKPWVKTVVITSFLVGIEDETPDSETAGRIAGRSDRFQELASKADDEDSTTGTGPAGEEQVAVTQ